MGGALASALSTPFVIWLSNRQGWLDHPGGRRIHDAPTPRAGGVAIFLGLLGGALVFSLLRGADSFLQPLQVSELAGFLGPCLLVFLIGLLDDIRGLSPKTRLLVEAIAAAGLIQAGYVIDAVATPWGPLALGIFAFPVTLLWVVGVTNAFNLIDGVDGLLPTAGIAALLGCAAVGLHMGMVGTPALALALAGALVGFLPYNWHPARIFPGDSASLVVGFTVAAWSLKVSRNPNEAIAIHAPLLICALPLAETALTLARRYVSGHAFFEGDRSHIHHVLLKKGLGVRRTVAVLGAVALSFSGAAYFSRYWREGGALASLLFLLAVCAIALRYLRYVELNLLLDRMLQALRKPRQGLPGVLALARAGNLATEASGPRELGAALAQAVELSHFDHVALLLYPAARARLEPEEDLRPRNTTAEAALESLRADGVVWFYSAERAPDPTQPRVELRFPLPLGRPRAANATNSKARRTGSLGVLVLSHTYDADAPLPSTRDLHRYLIGPLSATLERLANPGAQDDPAGTNPPAKPDAAQRDLVQPAGAALAGSPAPNERSSDEPPPPSA